MKITVVQTNVAYKDKQQNISQVSQLLTDSDSIGELVLLPELFSTGYIFESPEDIHELCEDFSSSSTIESLRELAELHDTVFVAGIAEKEHDHYYNSVAVVDKKGLQYHYRKISQTNIDKQYFDRGDGLATFSHGGVVFGIAICFDLWFPEIIRGYAKAGVDILLHPANFGGPQSLQISRARAIENSMHIVTCNRVGRDITKDLVGTYCGSSQVCAPGGELLAQFGSEPFAETVEINCPHQVVKQVIGVDLCYEIDTIKSRFDHLGEQREYKINLQQAICYRDNNQLESWVHKFLKTEGRNEPFSAGLELEEREFFGPVSIRTSLLSRCCGPEKNLPFVVDEEYFEGNVANIIARIKRYDDLPPLIINYADSTLVVNDGNHRLEAFKRCGFEHCPAIVWTTGQEDMDDFKEHFTWEEL